MILINLKEKIRTAARTPQFWRWTVFGLGLAIAAWLHGEHRRALRADRPLTIEEREVVAFHFEPLRARLPQVREWTENFALNFNNGRYATWLKSSLPHGQLAALDGARVVFTPKFFKTDPMTQEQWLVQVMAEASPTLESQLAARHDDNGLVKGTE